MISDYYSNYPTVVQNSITDLYDRVIQYVPNLIGALIVLLIGWALGLFLGNIIKRGLQSIGIDGLGDQLGLKRLSERSGRSIRISHIVQWIIKWFFILASIIAAADILGLNTVSNFFYSDVLGYAGHVVIATAILMLGLLAANFFSNVVEGTVKAGGFESSRLLGSIARWSITTFAIIAALSELQIAQSFLNYLFLGVVVMFALAGGLAFGLGGKDHARKVLDYVERGITKH
jgi:hypothetical protein